VNGSNMDRADSGDENPGALDPVWTLGQQIGPEGVRDELGKNRGILQFIRMNG